jgi:hypothetical protein
LIYFDLFLAVHQQHSVTCLKPTEFLPHNWWDRMDGLYLHFTVLLSHHWRSRRIGWFEHVSYPYSFIEPHFLLLVFFVIFLKRSLVADIFNTYNDLSDLFDVLGYHWPYLLHALELVVLEQISKGVFHENQPFNKGFNV